MVPILREIRIEDLDSECRTTLEALKATWQDLNLIDVRDESVMFNVGSMIERWYFRTTETIVDSEREFEREQETTALSEFLQVIFSCRRVNSVESYGILGHPKFKLRCFDQDSHNLRQEIDSSSTDAASRLNYVSAAVVHFANQMTDLAEQFVQMSRIKLLLSIVDPNENYVRLNSVIKSWRFISRARLSPILDESNVKGSYRLAIEIIEESGERHAVLPSLINTDSRTIKTKDGRFFCFTKDEAAFLEEAAKSLFLSQKQLGDLLEKPELIIPDGTDTERIDLSEYNHRVVGFETRSRIRVIEPGSLKIEWVPHQGHPPLLVFKGSDGELVSSTLSSTEEIAEAVRKIEAKIKEKSNSGTKGDLFIEFPKNTGNLFPVSATALNLLEQFLKSILEIDKTVNQFSGRKGRGEVAILREQLVERVLEEKDLSALKIDLREICPVPLDPHQVQGVSWLVGHMLKSRGGVILADEMGLGKTAQILVAAGVLYRLVQERSSALPPTIPEIWRPMLVVAPKILLTNWLKESEKFLHPDLMPNRRVVNSDDMPALLDEFEGDSIGKFEADFIATNYEALSSYQKRALRIDFSVAAFDESQNIKNKNTAKSIACRGLKSHFPICSTGTPVENSMADLWTQVDALNRVPMHPLGSWQKFIQLKSEDNLRIQSIRSALDADRPNTIILRRDKSRIKDLPQKIVHLPDRCEMSTQQEQTEQMIASLHRSTPFKMLDELRKLYQHPVLLSKNLRSTDMSTEQLLAESPKLSKTLEILKGIQLRSEKALVFTHIIEMQSILARVIEESFGIRADIINGESNSKGAAGETAHRMIEDFSSRSGFGVLILSPLAAGTGLNIVAANHVIHYGRWWNPAKEDQATDRAYRRGQTRDVHVYYPVLVNSSGSGYDLNLHKLVESKRRTARDFLEPIANLDLSDHEVQQIFEVK